MSKIDDLATEIWNDEFGGAANAPTVQFITSWLENNLGQLNTLLNTEFSGVDPEWQLEEPNIYKLLYLKHYYGKKARDTLRGIDEAADFITIREGDTMITRTNKNEVSKTYLNLSKDIQVEINDLVAKYNVYNSRPIEVDPSF